MNPFDFVNSINQSKKDLMTGTENDTAAEASYVPFVVNRSLSYFPDTIMHANVMNELQPTNKLQYHYLLNSIRPAKRFSKWAKRDDVGDLDAVKEYYGYSTEKALQALSILSSDHLRVIKEKLQSGGDK
jgi:hypothetical protein